MDRTAAEGRGSDISRSEVGADCCPGLLLLRELFEPLLSLYELSSYRSTRWGTLAIAVWFCNRALAAADESPVRYLEGRTREAHLRGHDGRKRGVTCRHFRLPPFLAKRKPYSP
jgi:hypothetical protein